MEYNTVYPFLTRREENQSLRADGGGVPAYPISPSTPLPPLPPMVPPRPKPASQSNTLAVIIIALIFIVLLVIIFGKRVNDDIDRSLDNGVTLFSFRD